MIAMVYLPCCFYNYLLHCRHRRCCYQKRRMNFWMTSFSIAGAAAGVAFEEDVAPWTKKKIWNLCFGFVDDCPGPILKLMTS